MSIDAPPRIYVFDFDQTITHIHTGGCAVTPEEISEEYIHSNLKDGFVELIDGLARKNISVYIATYGDDRFGRLLVNLLSNDATSTGQQSVMP